MKRPSQDAAEFVARLAELTSHLAAKDIVVGSLHANWSGFGCWELMAQNGQDAVRYREGLLGRNPSLAIGPEVVRVAWDGKESILLIEASPTRALCAPNEWATEFEQQPDGDMDEVIRFVEEYLTKRLVR